MVKNNNYYLAVLFVLTSVIPSYSQSKSKVDSICWCRDYKLKWSDFNGVTPDGSEWKAMSAISIATDGYRKGGLPTYDVISFFVKEKSWVKDTSENLLEHEKLHFDIGEVYARKMRQAVESLRKKGEVNMRAYRSAIDSLYDRWEKWGDAYDQETDNGLRASKQSEWTKKIRNELNALERYAIKCPAKYVP
jgi:hypothetical protein